MEPSVHGPATTCFSSRLIASMDRRNMISCNPFGNRQPLAVLPPRLVFNLDRLCWACFQIPSLSDIFRVNGDGLKVFLLSMSPLLTEEDFQNIYSASTAPTTSLSSTRAGVTKRRLSRFQSSEALFLIVSQRFVTWVSLSESSRNEPVHLYHLSTAQPNVDVIRRNVGTVAKRSHSRNSSHFSLLSRTSTSQVFQAPVSINQAIKSSLPLSLHNLETSTARAQQRRSIFGH